MAFSVGSSSPVFTVNTTVWESVGLSPMRCCKRQARSARVHIDLLKFSVQAEGFAKIISFDESFCDLADRDGRHKPCDNRERNGQDQNSRIGFDDCFFAVLRFFGNDIPFLIYTDKQNKCKDREQQGEYIPACVLQNISVQNKCGRKCKQSSDCACWSPSLPRRRAEGAAYPRSIHAPMDV